MKSLIDVSKIIMFSIIVSIIILIIGCGSLVYKKTIGVQNANVERKIFKENKIYNEGMTQDLSRYKLELNKTKDKVARKALIEHILEKYANFDENRIENMNLRNFLIEIKTNGGDF